MPRPQAALFVELDDDRDQADAEREAAETGPIQPWPAADPDLVLDRGPSKLWQRRIPGAGWVREIENETPCFALPTQIARTFGYCGVCGQFGLIVGEQRTRRGWEKVCKGCDS